MADKYDPSCIVQSNPYMLTRGGTIKSMYADEGFLCVTVGMGTDRAARPASVRIRIRVRVGVKVEAGLQTRQEDLLSHCFWQFDNVDFFKDPVRPMPSLFFSHAPARLPDHTAINANSNKGSKDRHRQLRIVLQV